MPDQNRALSTTFEFIGAEFDISYSKRIKQQPASHFRAVLVEDFASVLSQRNKLVSSEWLQIAVGRFTFCARIADDVGHMRAAVRDERLTTIVEYSKFAFPGGQCVSSDDYESF